MQVNDFTPPEDGEPTSFTETAKDWYEKHKPKIRAVGGVTLAVGLAVAAHLAGRQDATDIADSEPASGREGTEQSRRSLPDPERDPFLRRLPAGQHASEEARARYRELTGKELLDGWTVVRRWLYEAAV